MSRSIPNAFKKTTGLVHSPGNVSDSDALEQAVNLLISHDNANILDRHILLLKRRKNDLAPIARLPAEILTQILFLLATPLEAWEYKKEEWDWLVLTKVCRSWRMLVIGCSTFWTDLKPYFCKDKMEVFLNRSRQAELTIELSGNGSPIESDVLECICHHMKRVRKFEVRAGRNVTEWNKIQNLFEDKMPYLRVLCLSANEMSRGSFDDPIIILEKLALFEPLVCLEDVTLVSVILPWRSPVFHGLTSLCLRSIEEDSFRPTVNELLKILGASPNIHDLSLYHVGPRFSQSHSKRISVQQLLLIEIVQIEYKVLAEIFGSLDLPKNMKWSMEDVLNPFCGSENFPDNLLNCDAPCKGLTIMFFDYSVALNPIFQYSANSPEMTLDLCYGHADTLPHGTVSFFNLLRTFLQHPFFAKMTYLELDMNPLEENDCIASLTSAVWNHVFLALPDIERLELVFPRIRNEDSSLETHVIGGLADLKLQDETSNNVFLSNLKELTLNRAYFSKSRGRKAYNKLVSCLSFRQRNGKQLQILKFRECRGIHAEELEYMKERNVAEAIQQNLK